VPNQIGAVSSAHAPLLFVTTKASAKTTFDTPTGSRGFLSPRNAWCCLLVILTRPVELDFFPPGAPLLFSPG